MSFLLRLCLGLVVLVPSLAHAATLENPGDDLSYSGVGVISGWKCEAEGTSPSDSTLESLFPRRMGCPVQIPAGSVAMMGIMDFSATRTGEHSVMGPTLPSPTIMV